MGLGSCTVFYLTTCYVIGEPCQCDLPATRWLHVVYIALWLSLLKKHFPWRLQNSLCIPPVLTFCSLWFKIFFCHITLPSCRKRYLNLLETGTLVFWNINTRLVFEALKLNVVSTLLHSLSLSATGHRIDHFCHEDSCQFSQVTSRRLQFIAWNS